MGVHPIDIKTSCEWSIKYLKSKAGVGVWCVAERNNLDKVKHTIEQLEAENAGLKEQGDVAWEGLNNQIVELRGDVAKAEVLNAFYLEGLDKSDKQITDLNAELETLKKDQALEQMRQHK